MSLEEYWIGRGIDYRAVWKDYEDGAGYIAKFRSMPVHMIRFELDQFPKNLPLFNHEAVYKTFKGYFHDLKEMCLSRGEYDRALPLFLYSVERGSGVWTFLGELRQLVLFGTTLADQDLFGRKLDNMDKRLSLLRKHFEGAVNPKDFAEFMRAQTPRQLEAALQKLISQGIRKVEISTEPFEGHIEQTQRTLVDIKNLLIDTDDDAG